MKTRHKKMARCAFRSAWHVRIWNHSGSGEWLGPFARWHSKFRSEK